MSMEKNLKEILDEILDEVQKELDEATTTGNVDGYQTPYAFSKGNKHKKRKKKIATQLGYSVVGGDIDNINEAAITYGIEYKSSKKDRKFKKASLTKTTHNPNIDKMMIKAISKDAKSLAKQDGWVDYRITKDGVPVKESVNEGKFKPSQVRSAISRVKKQLMRKWKQKGGYENFGQKELSQMKDKFDYNPYGSSDERQISKMLDGFDNWAMNYDGNMREDINEAKVKRPVNRWLELKNDESMHPHKKMAMGLKELKYQLREVEKFFNWYNKIKTINELDSDKYWKRTNKHIYTIKERLIKIAKTIQEIEK
jgi:hypothetical protein